MILSLLSYISHVLALLLPFPPTSDLCPKKRGLRFLAFLLVNCLVNFSENGWSKVPFSGTSGHFWAAKNHPETPLVVLLQLRKPRKALYLLGFLCCWSTIGQLFHKNSPPRGDNGRLITLYCAMACGYSVIISSLTALSLLCSIWFGVYEIVE